MNKKERYYRESGHIGLSDIIGMTITGAVVACILACIYGYAICYIPFIYLNFFITLFFGGIVGFSISLVGKKTAVRNSSAVIAFGIAFGVVATYLGWVSWIYAASDESVLSFNLEDVSATIAAIAKEGSWGIFGITPTGAALYLIWTIESIVIIGASAIGALSGGSTAPYCEQCQRWYEEKELTAKLEPILNKFKFIVELENKNYSALTSLSNVNPLDKHRAKVRLMNCSSCNQNFALSVDEVVVEIDDDGERNERDNLFIDNLIIEKGAANSLEEWSKNISQKVKEKVAAEAQQWES